MSNIPLSIPGVRYSDDRPTIWGNSYTWSFARRMNQVQKLVIHHSVTIPSATAQDIALLHKARGWGGIGYHIVITSDGVVHYVGDIGTARANVAGNNEKVIGIVLVGDFRFGKKPTAAQIESTHKVCKYFMTQFPALTLVTDWTDVIGHQDTARMWSGATATICPGDDWKKVRQSIIDWKPPAEPTKPPESGQNIPNDGLYRVFHGSKQIAAYRKNINQYAIDMEKKVNDIQKVAHGNETDKVKVTKIKDLTKN